MKAISLWQPYASLWLTDNKIHETRHWPTTHRGWLIVHAAKRPMSKLDVDPELEYILDAEFGHDWPATLPLGSIIGTVNIIGCYGTEILTDADLSENDRLCGNFARGRYAWRRYDAVAVDKAIRYQGRQGMFNIEPDVLGLRCVYRQPHQAQNLNLGHG